MTWSGKFRVQSVGEGPAPIEVVAVAEGSDLTVNTEQALSMELRIKLDRDETALKVGDVITGSGHFQA